VQVRITASWAVANLCDALCNVVEAEDAKKASKITLSCTSLTEDVERVIISIIVSKESGPWYP